MFGRRPDGRRINKIDPIVQITPYIMPMRCDAQVLLKHRVDLEKMNRYIRAKRAEEGISFTHMHAFLRRMYGRSAGIRMSTVSS